MTTPSMLRARQVQEIWKGLEEARSGTPGISHGEVEKWVRSWGADHELPRPILKHSAPPRLPTRPPDST